MKWRNQNRQTFHGSWRKSFGRHLRVEALESRYLLAGDLIGDTLDTARFLTLTPDSTITAMDSVSTSNDVDIFSFLATEGNGVSITAEQPPEGTAFDSYMRLFDATGTEIASDDDSAGNLYPAIRGFAIPASGTYYVGVSSYGNVSYDPAISESGDGTETGDFLISVQLSLTLPPPDIEISGNDHAIVAFDMTPELADNTDFGKAQVLGKAVIRTFSITNLGGLPLQLTNDPSVQIGGLAADYFSVITQPDSPLDGNGSTTFQIAFDPSAVGLHTATVSVLSDDSDENPYVFLIQGTGTEPVPTAMDEASITVLGTIATPEQRDIYAIDLRVGQFLSAEIDTSENPGLDSQLILYDAQWRQLAYGNNAQSGSMDAALGYNVTSDGQYFLEIGSAPSVDHVTLQSMGDYALKLQSFDCAFSGAITTANREFEQEIYLPQSGRLDATLMANTQGLLVGELSLTAADGHLLLTAPADAASPRISTLSQFLVPGYYRLHVRGANGSLGGFQVISQFVAESSPLDRLTAGEFPQSTVSGDLNADGWPDLAIANFGTSDVSVLLGRGDGSFADPQRFAVGSFPQSLTTGDFNGDELEDLAVANSASNDISVLLSRGDGTFDDQQRFAVGESPTSLTSGDFNADGWSDLAVANSVTSNVSVLLGRGDGSFADPQRFAAGDRPQSLTTGDFNGDELDDIAVANSASNDVSVLLSQGNGSFSEQQRFAAGSIPNSLSAADFNGDGLADLVVANTASHDVSVLLSQGNGSFSDQQRLIAGEGPSALATGDLNGDTWADLAVVNSVSNDVLVLLGHGDGTFADSQRFVTGTNPRSIALGDFNADDQIDLAVANYVSHDVSTFFGRGDGSFVSHQRLAAGTLPASLAVGDFDADGRIDLVVANELSDDVSIMLSRGDGSFRNQLRYAAGDGPYSVAVADFNRDGRADLATANETSNDLSVLLGRGDGTFADQRRFATGVYPQSISVGDFNLDGHPDLAVANKDSNDISVLLGHGDGAFADQQTFVAGDGPQSLMGGDFNADGRIDIAVASSRPGTTDIAVLMGRGDGTFSDQQQFGASDNLSSLALGDFNNDGHKDLVVGNYDSNDVSVILGQGDGGFEEQQRFETGDYPKSICVGDFNADGRVDLAIGNSGPTNEISVLLGRGDGTFDDPKRFIVGMIPQSIAAGDFNGDGRLDLAVANAFSGDVSVLLGRGNGDFVLVSATTLQNNSTNPLLIADLTGDGMSDSTTIDRSGRILVRLGRADGAEGFAPPITVNSSPFGGQLLPHARDIAVIRSQNDTFRLVALDHTTDSLSEYSLDRFGVVVSYEHLAAPPNSLLARISAGDFNGDGNDDLFVSNPGKGEVGVLLAGSDGAFGSSLWRNYESGSGGLELLTADVDGDGHLDLISANQVSGDASVRLNRGNGEFGNEQRYRVSSALNGVGVDPLTDRMSVQSQAATNAIQVGDFDGDGNGDLLALNSRAHTYSLLLGSGDGRFQAPNENLVPGPISALGVGDFNRDGRADAAMLDPERGMLLVYLGTLNDGLTSMTFEIAAGNLPTSVDVQDISGPQGHPDGALDLIVGNESGDVLILPGRGDGTFEPFRRIGRKIGLTAEDLDGDGKSDFIYTNESQDRISVDFGQGDKSFSRDREHDADLLAPGRVRVADLNADGRKDLVVANTAGNSVLVYLGTGNQNGQPFAAARSFFVGVQPVDVNIVDLNADELLDLAVANEGSNDVTVLLGTGHDTDWTLTPGPRLKAGTGPSSVSVQDVSGPSGAADGIPDLFVTNRQSNNVYQMNGLGRGFFNDLTPTVFPVERPSRTINLPDFGQVVVRDGGLSMFSNFNPAQSVDFSTGGLGASYAVAGDFNLDGFSDMVVASNGNGLISLLVGRPTGFTLLDEFVSDLLAHPTDLTLVDEGGQLKLFGVSEGQDTAVNLSFVFGVFDAVPQYGPPGTTSEPTVALLPLQGSTLAVAATLLQLASIDFESSGDVDATESLENDLAFVLLDSWDEEAKDQVILPSSEVADDELLNNTPMAIAIRMNGFVMGLDEALDHILPRTNKKLLDLGEGELAWAQILAAGDTVFAEWSPAACAAIVNLNTPPFVTMALQSLLAGETLAQLVPSPTQSLSASIISSSDERPSSEEASAVRHVLDEAWLDPFSTPSISRDVTEKLAAMLALMLAPITGSGAATPHYWNGRRRKGNVV